MPGTPFAMWGRMIRRRAVWGFGLALTLCAATSVSAQDQDQGQGQSQGQSQGQGQGQGQSQGQGQTQGQTAAQTDTRQSAPEKADPDLRVDVLQPDFNLSSLPTTLRLPKHKLSFRLTHRFDRPLASGSFSDLLANFFGFDNGAQIGLELRYGLFSGTQVGVYRTSDRTIELFGEQSLWQQKPDGRPLSIDVIATFEGTNNLEGNHSPGVGLLVSKKIGRLAAYAEPIFVANTNLVDNAGEDNDTAMIGFGGRFRVMSKMYLVGEVTPRVAGYMPGVTQMSFGIEGRAGGHLFQLNFSNGLGTTLGQLARGGIDYNSWFIGFNLTRKFF
jgi:hypothetical protein